MGTSGISVIETNQIGLKILEALGIDANQVKDFTLRFAAKEFPTVTITRMVDDGFRQFPDAFECYTITATRWAVDEEGRHIPPAVEEVTRGELR